ncbi:hypothetical protein SAMN05216553_106225 [Lentzea fradiae]|uniref:Uncharacterized protein n=1 Tax=Lentzea fradiae TaxID=200378 RepID=A0A1G7SF75_9PSEU|nr:hypothetical protein [Lentzea fradiae]SDG21715.1 hypothetical protein SAMN05216553_106225 [Lentzea fradiae]
MDERELRTAMDRVVAVEPPPMEEEPVLSAGRRALRRRRAARASGWSAAAALVVTAGVTTLVPWQAQEDLAQLAVAPADKGVALAEALDALAPAGYGTPGDLTGTGDFAGRTLKSHKTIPVAETGGRYHAAGTPLTKDGAVGELLAAVYSPGWATGDGCAMTGVVWDSTTARCTEVEVDGKKVAVADVTPPPEDLLPPSQWAGYRHPDGTAVFVMQSPGAARSGRPALGGMPMTAEQLAAAAVDPRLKVE